MTTFLHQPRSPLELDLTMIKKQRSRSPGGGKVEKPLSCLPSGSTWALSSVDSSHNFDSPQNSRHNSHSQLRHTATESTNDLIYSPDESPINSPFSSKSYDHSECPGQGTPNINWAQVRNEINQPDFDGFSRLSRMSSRSSVHVIDFVPEETEEEIVDFEIDDEPTSPDEHLTIQLTLANMQANEEYCRQFASNSTDDVSELTNEDGSLQRLYSKTPVVKTAKITKRRQNGRHSPSPKGSELSLRDHCDEESSYGDEIQSYQYGVELFLEHASPKKTKDCCTSPMNPNYISPSGSPYRGIANTSQNKILVDNTTSPLQHYYPEDVAPVTMSRTGSNKNDIPLTLGMTERRTPNQWISEDEVQELKHMALKNSRILVGWQVLLFGPDGADLGVAVITDMRKQMMSRKTYYRLSTIDNPDCWARLKKADHKDGVDFRPLRQVFTFDKATMRELI